MAGIGAPRTVWAWITTVAVALTSNGQRYAIRASMSPAGSVAKDLIGGLRVEPAFWAMSLGLVSHCLRVSASCLLPIASRAPLGFPTPPTEWHILHFCSS